MASSIDATKPTATVAYTADVRQNFSYAKSEIEALQGDVAALPIANINLDGGTDIGVDLADADLLLVDDGGAGTNRKSALSRVWTYILAKLVSASPQVSTLELGNASDTTLARSAEGVVSVEGVNLGRVIASGTSALGTSAISSGAAATLVTTSATGVATTDVITWGFNTDPNAVTGYDAKSTSGCLVITAYPTANNVNFLVSNPTAGSITPGALTLNWRVVR